MNTLKQALDSMDKVFSSSQFCRAIAKNGIVKVSLTYRGASKYLELNRNRLSEKTWEKIEVSINEGREKRAKRINDAIQLLKSEGYKILKPINKWKEL